MGLEVFSREREGRDRGEDSGETDGRFAGPKSKVSEGLCQSVGIGKKENWYEGAEKEKRTIQRAILLDEGGLYNIHVITRAGFIM